MARSIEDIEKDIRELSQDEKRDLLRVLIDELDRPPDPDVEKSALKAALLGAGLARLVRSAP